MLHNPWRQATLLDFISWLQSKPPEKEYEFCDNHGACMMGQYMSHIGIDWAPDVYMEVCHQIFSPYFEGGNYSTGIGILTGYPRTFGGALERTKMILRMKAAA